MKLVLVSKELAVLFQNYSAKYLIWKRWKRHWFREKGLKWLDSSVRNVYDCIYGI